MFALYLFLRFKVRREIRQINPSQTLMNLQYNTRDFDCDCKLFQAPEHV